MRVQRKNSIVHAKVLLACDFDSAELELLFDGGSAIIQIRVYWLNVENDELAQSIAAHDGLEGLFPVCCLIDLKRAHCLHIDNMHELGDLVDEDERAYAAQILG